MIFTFGSRSICLPSSHAHANLRHTCTRIIVTRMQICVTHAHALLSRACKLLQGFDGRVDSADEGSDRPKDGKSTAKETSRRFATESAARFSVHGKQRHLRSMVGCTFYDYFHSYF